MIAPPTPANETARQAALERYEILDTLPERAYDDITALMAQVCCVPISLVGLIDRDRNWLKSHHGIPVGESPRVISFCGHAIVSGEEIFVVEDAREDPRFADNPLVTELGAIGYAGVPLIDADGYALGTLCVFDYRPLTLDGSCREALRNMARQVIYLLERHLNERRLEQAARELAARNEELRCFAGTVSHDIRSPVTNIVELARLIEHEAGERLDAESREDLRDLKESSISLRSYLDGLLAHYTADELVRNEPETFALDELFHALDPLFGQDSGVTIEYPEPVGIEIGTRQAALQQILLNLVANAIKHGSGDDTRIRIGFEEEEDRYRFHVADNGPGIEAERHESIFGLFNSGEGEGTGGTGGSGGTGIGLATVRKLLDRLGGTIELDSAPGRGCTFTFTLPAMSPAAPSAQTDAA